MESSMCQRVETAEGHVGGEGEDGVVTTATKSKEVTVQWSEGGTVGIGETNGEKLVM